MIEPVHNHFSGEPEESAAIFAGQILKAARENKKMTLEEVAERLHLDIDIIKAIESDNYKILPGSTYVKGYLRSYAGLLGVPLSDVSFQDDGLTNRARLLPENVNYANETKARKLSYFWGSAVLLLFLIIFSSYIQMENADKEQVITESLNDAPVEKFKSKAEQQVDSYQKSDNRNIIQTLKSADTKIAEAESKSVVFSGLILDYKEDSWTEVYDLNGKKLVYGKIKQGEKIQVDGLQPYSVLLGNADAVNVKFENEDFSLTKYTRNGIAQFVIGSTFNNK